MFKDNKVALFNIKLLYETYKEAGMTTKEMELAVAVMEPLILGEVIDDLLDTADSVKEEEVTKMMEEKADLQTVTKALGLSDHEMQEKLLQKLEKYVYNLKKNAPELTERLRDIHSQS